MVSYLDILCPCVDQALLSAAAQCAHAAVGVVEQVRKHNQLLLRQWEEYGAAKVAVKVQKEAEMVSQGCECTVCYDAVPA